MSGNTNKYVFDFLREISPYLVGLGRKSKLKYTLLASPYLSSMIGVDIFDGQLHLGVPEALFRHIYKLRIYSLSIIPGTSNFFIVFDTDLRQEGSTHPMAIRFYLRTEMLKLFEKYQKVHIVSINENGEFSKRKGNHIPLPIREIDHLEWEK